MLFDELLLLPHYLPNTAYLAYCYRYPKICLDVYSFYEKQTYQNRCYISTSQGTQKLIVPIMHVGRKQRYKEVRIDYSAAWHTQHMRAMSTAYGKAPFYDVVSALLFPILERKPHFLRDLSIATLEVIFKLLRLRRTLHFTTSYVATPSPATLDIRTKLHPKREVKDLGVLIPVYEPIFQQPFVPNLSVIDLLFCEGPHAADFYRSA